jgi:hypothetical protein
MAHLYVACHGADAGILKVGRSDNPQESGQPFVNLMATFPGLGHLETDVHRLLAPLRVDGQSREWFRVDLDVVLESVAKAIRGKRAEPEPFDSAERVLDFVCNPHMYWSAA